MGRHRRERVERDVGGVLRAAANLVSKGWTRQMGAADGTGNPCGPLHPDACCWCATGALQRAARESVPGMGTEEYAAAVKLYERAVVVFQNFLARRYLQQRTKGKNAAERWVQRWNDSTDAGRSGSQVALWLRRCAGDA